MYSHKNYINIINTNKYKAQVEDIFFYLHSFLIHSANVYKLIKKMNGQSEIAQLFIENINTEDFTTILGYQVIMHVSKKYSIFTERLSICDIFPRT